jgi:hypothetical protein
MYHQLSPQLSPLTYVDVHGACCGGLQPEAVPRAVHHLLAAQPGRAADEPLGDALPQVALQGVEEKVCVCGGGGGGEGHQVAGGVYGRRGLVGGVGCGLLTDNSRSTCCQGESICRICCMLHV